MLSAELQEQNWQCWSEMNTSSPQHDEMKFESEQFACRMLTFDNVEILVDTGCDNVEDCMCTNTNSDV